MITYEKQTNETLIQGIIEQSYDILIRKIGEGTVNPKNEASFQLEFGCILKTIGNLYQFDINDQFNIEFESQIELKSESIKSGTNKARVDILIKYSSGGVETLAAIELKFFKKANHREPNNRYDVFKDLSNLEQYKNNGIDICYFILATDHSHYVDPKLKLSNDTGDFDFRDGAKYRANTKLEYKTAKPYGDVIFLNQNYIFTWVSINKLYFLKLEL